MLIHTVLFWCKPGCDLAGLRAGLESLRGIPSVRQLHVGGMVDTGRPVVDTTYDMALTVVFDDRAGHDLYQSHPLHLAFLDRCRSGWRGVRVFDYQ